jgi:hypothetical protein
MFSSGVDMKFGRKLSFTGSRIFLDFQVRQRLCKEYLPITKMGTVMVYDKNPKSCLGAQPIATLTPEICSTGRLQAVWDIPEDACPGTYYDSWEGFEIDGKSKTYNKIQQFFVSDDLYSMEEFLKPEYDITLCKDTVWVDTKEYIVFKMLKPESLIFPDAEVRIVHSTVGNARFEMTIRKTGPGLNEPVQSNASFPEENIVIADVPLTVKSEFIPISTFCDEAYFYLDLTGARPGVYQLQLKLKTGEVEQVVRPVSLRVNSADLKDSSGIYSEILNLNS